MTVHEHEILVILFCRECDNLEFGLTQHICVRNLFNCSLVLEISVRGLPQLNFQVQYTCPLHYAREHLPPAEEE